MAAEAVGGSDPFDDIPLDGGQGEAYARGLAEGGAVATPLELREEARLGAAEGEALGALLGAFAGVAAALQAAAGAAGASDEKPKGPRGGSGGGGGGVSVLPGSLASFAAATDELVAAVRASRGFPADDAGRHALLDRLLAQSRRCEALCRASRNAVPPPPVLREFQTAFAPAAAMDW